jgi:hypothetical protein
MKLGKGILFSIILLSFVVVFSSCKKKCSAGSGGSLTIVLSPQHHGRPINNLTFWPDTVWVKYNTQDAPSSLSAYDAHFVGVPGTNTVRLTGLQCGDYYFFATGNDSLWAAPNNTHVTGGLPYSTTQTSGEIDMTIAVNE